MLLCTFVLFWEYGGHIQIYDNWDDDDGGGGGGRGACCEEDRNNSPNESGSVKNAVSSFFFHAKFASFLVPYMYINTCY